MVKFKWSDDNVIMSISALILIYVIMEMWKKYRWIYHLAKLKNETREYIKKLVKVPGSTKLILSYTHLITKEEQISQDIYNIFGIWPINIGSVAFGCWTEHSNLNLAISYSNNAEFERIMKIANQFNVQKINETFFGQERVNFIIDSLIQYSDKFSSQKYDVDFVIKICQQDEIGYIIKGARAAILDITPDKHIEWNQYVNFIDNWRNVLILREQFYERYIPELCYLSDTGPNDELVRSKQPYFVRENDEMSSPTSSARMTK